MNCLDNLSTIKKLCELSSYEAIIDRINKSIINYSFIYKIIDGNINLFLKSYRLGELNIINGNYYNEYYLIRFIGVDDKEGYIMFPFELIDSDEEIYNEFIRNI